MIRVKSHAFSLTTSLFLVAFATPLAHSQCTVIELQKAVASDATSGDLFGGNLALDGDIAVIGARFDDDACPSDPRCDSGSAYVFRHNGRSWTQTQKLTARDHASKDLFGNAVSKSEDVIAIGAPGKQNDRGAVYIFRHRGGQWTEEERIEATDLVTGDRFGASVSIDKDTLFVGAPKQSAVTGAVYVFEFDGTMWRESAKLLANDAEMGDQFGSPVSVLDHVAVIGAWFDDETCAPLTSCGSAYVFRRQGDAWIQEAKLFHPGAHEDYAFGCAVALGDNRVLAAGHGADSHTGAVHVYHYEFGQWIEEQELRAADPAIVEYFGSSVAFDGETIVVGAFGGDGLHGEITGAAHVFRHDGSRWVETKKLLASDGETRDSFGSAVGVHGDRALVTAKIDGLTGSAYFFDGITSDLVLIAKPQAPLPGQTIEILTSCGKPSGLALLAVVALNGHATFLPIVGGSFDAADLWEIHAQVPTELSGWVIDLQVIGESHARVDDTNIVSVSVQ